jgi:hypothetical protein
MSKDPAFLFYDGDAARDVSHMNRLERGCYFDLVQAQRKFGGYTVEKAQKILGKDFDTCWPSLELILLNENGVFCIEWVRESIKKRSEHADLQRKRIQDYWDKKKNTTVLLRYYHGNTLENENANANENANEKGIEKATENLTTEVNFFTQYPESIRSAFLSYWTEPTRSKTKIRAQTEKTWDTARRLATWASRDKSFNKTHQKQFGRQEIPIADLQAQMERIHLEP